MPAAAFGRAARHFCVPRAPLSGAEVTATGSGTFESLRNDFRFRVDDLFVGEEGVGVNGTLALRHELSGEIAPPRPAWRSPPPGRIALTQSDAELTFRFRHVARSHVRLFVPKLSPFTTAVVSGAIRVRRARRLRSSGCRMHGRLARHAAARLRREERRADPIALDRSRSHRELQLVGDDTRLRCRGTAPATNGSPKATGEANLASCRASSATCAAPAGGAHGVHRRAARAAAVPAARRSPAAHPHFSIPNASTRSTAPASTGASA
jgi:hypothetical protein